MPAGTDMQSTSTDATASGQTISIRGLGKRYGVVDALAGVDLDIRRGEFVTLLGPSGSGKTTLLMALAGFIRPTEGSIKFGGQEVVALPPHKRNVGMVFQSYALFPHMTVGANVAYPLRVRRISRAEIQQRVSAALALVRLSELAERNIDQLSGGQRQRVALARAVIFHPQILLMDEPLSALDKHLREEMQIEIRHLQQKLGITTVSVTHDQREALTMADRVAVLDRGRLVQIDSPERLYGAPATSFVAGFLGETTLLDVRIEDGIAYLAGRPLRTPHRIPRDDRTYHLVLRAEKLEIVERPDQADCNVFAGQVQELVFQGDSLLIYVGLADGRRIALRRPTARLRAPTALQPGTSVHVALPVQDTLIVPNDWSA